VTKYNEEVAGWKQLQIRYLQKTNLEMQLEKLSEELSISILRHVEDFLFVNQLVNKEEFKVLQNGASENKELIQMAHQSLLDIMEHKH